MRLSPDPVVTPQDHERGRRALVVEAAFATTAGALYGGVILVGYALELGASPLTVGLLAAIPFLAQVSQVPAILLVERVRARRKITVLSVSAARVLIMSLALLPLLPERPLQLAALIGLQVAIALLGAVGGCAFNSWVHDLVPREMLGTLFARRLFWSTLLASLAAMAGGYSVQHWPYADRLHAYAAVFVAAGIAGLVSSRYLAAVPEPAMERTGPRPPLGELLGTPLRDPDFRGVVVFMAAWNFASNIAAPFITVYLLRQLGYQLGTVTTLWMVGQVATALAMYLWGRLSDRLSNKAVLSVALPAYFVCVVALTFTALPQVHMLTLPLLVLVHLVMGAASGGITLATGNLGLKLAPRGRGTAYLAAVGLAGSLAAGVAALAGGVLAEWFSGRGLVIAIHLTTPQATEQVRLLQFRHWEFLFAISFLLGFYVLHRLSRIREGEEHSERVVVQQFVLEAFRSIDQLSPIDGLRTVILFPFGRLRDRRLRPRGRGNESRSDQRPA